MILSRLISLASLSILVLFFAACATPPELPPTPEQTEVSSPSSHPGWVDVDVVSAYGEGAQGLELRQEPSEPEVKILDEVTSGADTSMELQEMVLEPIYFDFDQAAVSPEQRSKLQKVVDFLKQNPSYRLRIEGHCDWRGTSEYNLILGDRRANSVKQFLTLLGISSKRLDILSQGDQFATINGSAEQMSRDRRADLMIIKGTSEN